MTARVVHCMREPFDIYIGRRHLNFAASIWGNPFHEGLNGTREEVIAKYRIWLLKQPQLLDQLQQLRGKVLGCWCHPKPCHGDVLLELANA